METIKKGFLILGICLLVAGGYFVFKSVLSGMEGKSDKYDKMIANLPLPPKPDIKSWSPDMVAAEPGKEVSLSFTDFHECIDGLWRLDDETNYGKPEVILTFADNKKEQKSLLISGVNVSGTSPDELGNIQVMIFSDENPSKRVKPLSGSISFTLPSAVPPGREAHILFTAAVASLELKRGALVPYVQDSQEKKIYNYKKEHFVLGVKKSIYVTSASDVQKLQEYRNSMEFHKKRISDLKTLKAAKLQESEWFQKNGLIIIMISLAFLFAGVVLGQKRR